MTPAAAAPPIVEVRNLVFDYPTSRALFGVSFMVEAGSITALVGPNGAGKTTLMRCLAALETPFSGSVLIEGMDVEIDPREAHSRMGFLQDFFGLYDELTVRQCLAYHSAAHGVAADEREAGILRCAERLGIADRIDQKAGTLSRGLRQRLAVAQTIIHHPRLLLLDEPASGLDPEARQELSRLLLTLRDEGITLIVSSHILAELEDYSTHMMIMRDGRVTEHSAIGEIETASAQRMRIVLAKSHRGLKGVLEKAEGVADISVEGTVATFAYSRDEAARAALLRSLVEAGLAVSAFHPEQRSMQDVYMDRVQQSRDGPDQT